METAISVMQPLLLSLPDLHLKTAIVNRMRVGVYARISSQSIIGLVDCKMGLHYAGGGKNIVHVHYHSRPSIVNKTWQ